MRDVLLTAVPGLGYDAEELFQPMEHELTIVEEYKFDENNCTSWTGGVNHVLSESEDELEEWIEDGDNEGEGLDADLEELAPEEVLENLQCECQSQADMEVPSRPTPYEKVLANKPTKFWKKVEAHWHLGYNGQSDQTKCYHSQQLCEKELKDAITRKNKTADKFHSFFAVHLQQSLDVGDIVDDTFHGYISDLSDNENEIEAWISDDEDSAEEVLTCSSNIIPPPPSKCQKLSVSDCDAQKQKKVQKMKKLQEGLTSIEKLIASKQNLSDTGHNGLQAYQAQAIQSCLLMILKGNRKFVEALEMAAESHGFAKVHGGCLIKEKIIPAFEKAHPLGYQMLMMVDNSQGHSAYAENALLVNRMNMNSGGKQSKM
ncbi:hypothetical protein BDQ17DRAFT_1325166 [Cyathus striatus]|nr:hypothetical protein BDQ17DRAFT_1325166 [Cyathus striatus]